MYWLSIYLEVLYVDVWLTGWWFFGDSPFCWFRSLVRASVSSTETFGVSSWDSELSELVDKDKYQGGEVYIFPPSYLVKVNRWLLQFSTYSEWQYHGMAQSMNIKMSISEQGWKRHELSLLDVDLVGSLLVMWCYLDNCIIFRASNMSMILDGPPAHIRGEVSCFLECWKSCGAGGVSWAGVEIAPQDAAAFFFGSLVSLVLQRLVGKLQIDEVIAQVMTRFSWMIGWSNEHWCCYGLPCRYVPSKMVILCQEVLGVAKSNRSIKLGLCLVDSSQHDETELFAACVLFVGHAWWQFPKISSQ